MQNKYHIIYLTISKKKPYHTGLQAIKRLQTGIFVTI